MCVNKYRNPRSKRKLKAKAKRQAEAKPIPLQFDSVISPPSPDEIVREQVREKRGRIEPTSFKKERPLKRPYSASGGNKTVYYSKSPASGGVKCALAES